MTLGMTRTGFNKFVQSFPQNVFLNVKKAQFGIAIVSLVTRISMNYNVARL